MAVDELVCAFGWEDPEPLVRMIAGEAPRCLVIERCGELGFALVAAGAVVDVLPPDGPSAALLALKRCAAEQLPPASARSLLGLGYFGRRVWFYHYLRGGLDAASRGWWDAHEATVRLGIVGAGRVERAWARWRRTAGALALGEARLAALAAASDRRGREAWWQGLGRARRIALGVPLRPAMVKRACGLVARPVGEGAASLSRLGEIVVSVPFHRSDGLERAWTGGWRDPAGGPAWLDPERAGALRTRIGAHRLLPMGSEPGGGYDLVVVGDEPERWPDASRGERLGALAHRLRPGGLLAGWERVSTWPVPPGLVDEPAPATPVDRTLGARRLRLLRVR